MSYANKIPHQRTKVDQTRKLHLSPSDLERIYRYKANPKKGGWQSRFKKIFGRHFPDESGLLLLKP